MAIDSSNILHAAIQSGSSRIYHYYTTSTHPDVVGDWSNETAILEVSDSCYFPKIAVDDEDNLHIIYELEDWTVYGNGDHGIAYLNNKTGWSKTVLDLPNLAANESWDHDPDISVHNSLIYIVFIKNCVFTETGDYGNVWTYYSNDYGSTWNPVNKIQITNYVDETEGAAYPTLRWSKNYCYRLGEYKDCDWVRNPLSPQLLYFYDLSNNIS